MVIFERQTADLMQQRRTGKIFGRQQRDIFVNQANELLNGRQLIAQCLASRNLDFHFTVHVLATGRQIIEQSFSAGIKFAIQCVVFATEGIARGKHSCHNFLALALTGKAQDW
jgi:hypothetical protein